MMLVWCKWLELKDEYLGALWLISVIVSFFLNSKLLIYDVEKNATRALIIYLLLLIYS